MVNQQFRKDYWVKGARRLTSVEQRHNLIQQKVLLSSQKGQVKLSILGTAGEAKLSQEIYGPILELLSDHQPHTLDELSSALEGQVGALTKTVEAIKLLTGQGYVHPAQSDEIVAKAAQATQRLNSHLMKLARSIGDVPYLASPVTGGAVTVNRFHQMFLMALQHGKTSPQEWVAEAWTLLRSQNQLLTKQGNVLQSEEENLAELAQMAKDFEENQIPILRGMGVM
jgi:hypothetical protein